MMLKIRLLLILALLFVVGLATQAQADCSTKTLEEWELSGAEFYSAGQYTEAIADFTCAIELGTQDAVIYFARAYSQYEQGLYAEAIVDFTSAIELDPEYSGAYIDRAWANLRLNNIDETVHADFLRWIELEATEDLPGTLDAALTVGNLPIEPGWVYRLTFDGQAGQEFGAAVLSADATDPLIVLVAPNGSALISDDDSGVNLNSVIRHYTLPETGTYALVISQAGASGTGLLELAVTMDGELRSSNAENTSIRDSFIVYNLYIDDVAEVFTTEGDRLNLRSGPGTNFEVIDQLERGELVTLLDGPLKNEDGDGFAWWLVRADDGTEGWAVERVVEEQTLQLALIAGEEAYVTSGDELLNVRETASRSGAVGFQLEDGVQVTLLDEAPVLADNFRWWHIRDAEGREGWAVDRIGIERTLVPVREFPDGL
jgi:uncharacterized protein YgiM (DUF1202 family)